ncbi:MAG: hypothetical protein JW705_01810, partial [Methanosarcinaceae archaeon]|nr:hypothetical protein [Methanosarcinaceae archaeon]
STEQQRYASSQKRQKREFEEAIRCYDRIFIEEKLSYTAPVMYNKSLALRSMGRYEAALNFSKKVLKYDPGHNRAKELIEEILELMRSHATTAGKRTMISPQRLAVNIIYAEWQPPAVSTLLAHSLRCGHREIKYHRGFGEDLIREKAIQDKLQKRTYCCRTCGFQEKNVCKHPKTKGMAVSDTAICRHFKPQGGFENKMQRIGFR